MATAKTQHSTQKEQTVTISETVNTFHILGIITTLVIVPQPVKYVVLSILEILDEDENKTKIKA